MAISKNRKAIGVELKDTYYRQALKNIAELENNGITEQYEMVLP